MPVLPEVGSIRVSPGLISPRASAWRIIEIAGRSLTEPAGLLPSSFARIAFLFFWPGSRCSLTSGVLPMKSSRSRLICGSLALQLLHVGRHAFLHGPERRLVAGGAQLREVGL